MASKWLSRILTLALWALAALSLSYWSLKFIGASDSAINATRIASASARVVATDLSRALGPPIAGAQAGQGAVAATGLRMQLLGVAANRASAGVALIAVDGKVARPYRVGSKIEDAYTLTSVSTRSATLTPAAQPATSANAIKLELVPVGASPPSATSAVTLPPAVATAAAAAAVVPTRPPPIPEKAPARTPDSRSTDDQDE